MKPRMFIGSSVEGKDIAEHIQLGLEYDVETTIWHQGIFGLSDGSLESLVRAAKDFDFAALVLTPDDLVMKRGTEKGCPRDNVVFELGLFMGALGRERTFIVYNRDKQLDLPTDLAGVTPATFADRSDNNLQAALGPVCTKIKRAIKDHGLKARHLADAVYEKDELSFAVRPGSVSPVLAAGVVRSMPHILDHSPLFRDVIVRKFQAVPADERPRPRPVPSRTEKLPPWVLSDPTLLHVTGWHVRLRIGMTYRLRWDLALTKDWIETEFVLFQHVADPVGVFDHYERITSVGAFATDQWPDHITPTAESWLIGCYSKRCVGWDAPWYEMTPYKYIMKDDGRSLEFLFTRSSDSYHGILEDNAQPAIWLESSTAT